MSNHASFRCPTALRVTPRPGDLQTPASRLFASRLFALHTLALRTLALRTLAFRTLAFCTLAFRTLAFRLCSCVAFVGVPVANLTVAGVPVAGLTVAGVGYAGVVFGAPSPLGASEEEPPSLTALERTVRAALRRHAVAREPADRTAAIQELCELHHGIVRDPRFRSVVPLQELRRQIASRLLGVQTDLKRQMYRNRQSTGTGTGGSESRARAGGDGVPDNGQALVDLIQRTIHPDFWDVNGGPGTILYYRPLRCLVVRATDEVHGNVGGAVRGLRGNAPPNAAGP